VLSKADHNRYCPPTKPIPCLFLTVTVKPNDNNLVKKTIHDVVNFIPSAPNPYLNDNLHTKSNIYLLQNVSENQKSV